MQDITTISSGSLDCMFMKIKRKIRRKKFHGKNTDFHFVKGSFSYRKNVRTIIWFRSERNPRFQSLIFTIDKNPNFVTTFPGSANTCNIEDKTLSNDENGKWKTSKP